MIAPFRYGYFCSAATILLASACVPSGTGGNRQESKPGDQDAGRVADTGVDRRPGGGDAGTTAKPDSGTTVTPTDAGCTPSCTTQVCGDDGCGGSCGTCEVDEACSAAGLCESTICPPSGPVGIRVGQTIPDVTLSDCEGNLHSLQDLCLRRASYFFIFAGW